jgi:hypothetical protein
VVGRIEVFGEKISLNKLVRREEEGLANYRLEEEMSLREVEEINFSDFPHRREVYPLPLKTTVGMQGELEIKMFFSELRILEEVGKKERVRISYPNPLNPECYIPVNVKGKRQNVKCKIYNILGQLVREIEITNFQSQISKSIYWDGRDSRGLEVPAGVYFYEVAGEGVRRMVVLR